MNKNNLFSVVICAYNEEKNIAKKIINSLEVKGNIQEIIIVNDYCQDNTEKIVKKYQAKNSQIKLIKNKYDKGKAGALQSGIELAEGNWLVLTDCDVIVDTDILINFDKINNLRRIWVVGSRAKNRRWDWEMLEIIRMKLLPAWLTRGQLMIVRNHKSLFENFEFADDIEIAFKALRSNGQVVNCEKIYFTDYFRTGIKYYRQFWRRSLAMNKVIWRNICLLFSRKYFSFKGIISNVFFLLLCYCLPFLFCVSILISIYHYWKIVLLWIVLFPIIMMPIMMIMSTVYALLTLHHKGNFNWKI